jgi:hypothetical protein
LRELLAALAVGTPFVVGASVAPERDADVVWTFDDARIVESSGLVADDDLVVTVNDSGSDAVVYAVDRATGRTVGTTTWDADPDDTEALAPAGPGHVWVGDIGDNARDRGSITVTRVPYGRGTQSVSGESWTLTYPAGASHDAEALLAHPRTGRLYVVTKGVLAGEVYAAPRKLRPGANRLRKMGTAPGMVTDGAFLDDEHVLLRGYGSADVLTFPGLDEVGSFALPPQQQGEGLAVAPDGEVLVSSEGMRSPLLRVEVPARLRSAMADSPRPSATPGASPSPEPSASPPQDESPPAGDDGDGDGDPWRWVAAGAVAVCAGVLLLRSLRRR